MKVSAFAAISATVFASVQGETFFEENFNSGDISNWVKLSKEGLGDFELVPGQYYKDEEDLGLKTKNDASFYGLAAKFTEPFDNTDDTMVVQVSVKHEQHIDCGGGYIKIFPHQDDLDLAEMDTEKYNIMFGPDICGSKKMVHLIFSYKEQNYLIKKNVRAEADTFSHAYTLILSPDNTYKILIDNKEEASGSLTEDWDMLKPKNIKDPESSKPEDWVDEETIEDPEDVKPDNYDDIPAEIPDPDAIEPEEWDEEMDGEYAVPFIPNPEYQGEWEAKRIPNPAYKGEWVHPLIDNPEYEEDASLYAYNHGGIVFDLWQVKSGSIFDDLLVTNNVEEAKDAADAIIERQKVERDLHAAAEKREELMAEIKAKEMKENDESFIEEDNDEQDYDLNDEDEHDEL